MSFQSTENKGRFTGMRHNRKIFAFTGRQKSGKDTSADILIRFIRENYPEHTLERFAFADPLKRVCSQAYCHSGIPEKVFYGTQEDKAADWGPYGFPGVTGRGVLNKISDVFKSTYPNIWLDTTKLHTENSDADFLIYTDCRMEYEEMWLRSLGGILIRTNRKLSDFEDPKLHHSEAGISKLPVKYELDNNGSLDFLEEQIIAIVKQEIE